MKTQVQEPIKTTRFTAIVEAAGRPDVHVLLTAPENDKVLQSAIKQNRVMTIEQGRTRGKMDRGSIGFSPGPIATVSHLSQVAWLSLPAAAWLP